MYKVAGFLLLGAIVVSGAVVGPAGSTLSDTSHGEVAFSTGLSHTLRVTNGDTITFDKIFTNVGNGYNLFSGIFTAPQSGLYIFHLHAYDMNKDKAMWLEIVKDTELLVSISGYDSHSTAGNTVITSLVKGSRVFVRSRPGQQFSLFGQHDEIYATFTGYKISDLKYQDETPSQVQDPFQFLPGGR